MTKEQLKAITEKMESLFQERWVRPLNKIIDAERVVDDMLINNKYRLLDHGIDSNSERNYCEEDPFGKMDMYLRFGHGYTNIIFHKHNKKDNLQTICDMREFHNFIKVFYDGGCCSMDGFVSHTWGGNTSALIELKRFLEDETEEYFKVLASLVETVSKRVTGWLDACSEAEEKASKILLKEFGFETEIKKAKVLKITVEEVEQ